MKAAEDGTVERQWPYQRGWRGCNANHNVSHVKRSAKVFDTYIDDKAVATGWEGDAYKLKCGGKGQGNVVCTNSYFQSGTLEHAVD